MMKYIGVFKTIVRRRHKPVRYILRPRDGIKEAPSLADLPAKDPAHSEIEYRRTRDEHGDLYVAVCSFCGGNCGQCATSVGQGVPFSFDRVVKSAGADKPGWGFYRRGR